MRNLVAHIVAWLCHRYALAIVPDQRIKAPTDVVARGQQWAGFYYEEGGLRDMIAAIRGNYFEAAGALGVADTAKLFEYALADRLARELDRSVVQIIASGKATAQAREFAEREKNARILRAI